MNKKRILVTGGNGFIAHHVIKRLQKDGYQVVTNVRSLRKENEEFLKDVEVYPYIDVRDQTGIMKLIEQCDGVIHLAAVLGTKHVDNAKMFYETNLFGTINVLEGCKEFGVPLTYICVGNHHEHNNYSNSKVAAKREVLKYAKYCGVKANVVTALNAVGPYQKWKNTGKIMATFCMAALKDEPLSVYGGREDCSLMDLVYVGDVAKVLVNVLEKTMAGEANGQEFEAGTGIAPSVWEIAEAVVRLSDSKSEIKEVPMRPGETVKSLVVAENPYPLKAGYLGMEETIKKAITYYSTQI